MAKKILLVGCGELGSRHLQAIAALEDVSDIYVVDPSENALELGRKRLKESQTSHANLRIHWKTQLDADMFGCDLCIVATLAKGRCELILNLADSFGCRSFLVEKIVTQSAEDYERLLSEVEKRQLFVWVNCKTRAYQIHRYIKSKLKSGEPFILSHTSSNIGLATNGIHPVDLFVFFDEPGKLIHIASRIDPILHPSKRGKDFYDLSGSLYGSSDKGSSFSVSYLNERQGIDPDLYTIFSPSVRFMVDKSQEFAFESNEESNWKWRQIPMSENVYVSHLSKTFVQDILASQSCALPTLRQCSLAHLFLLNTLLPEFSRLKGKKLTHCPVT